MTRLHLPGLTAWIVLGLIVVGCGASATVAPTGNATSPPTVAPTAASAAAAATPTIAPVGVATVHAATQRRAGAADAGPVRRPWHPVRALGHDLDRRPAVLPGA